MSAGVWPQDRRYGLTWVKSSLSFANGDCALVARTEHGSVLVRDSKDANGPCLIFTASEWDAFIEGAKAGQFDAAALPL
jgi:hypothetical protein